MKYLVLFFLILTSCSNNLEVFEHDDIKIKIPNWVDACKDLNEDAPYQWKNEDKDFYIIINAANHDEVHKVLNETDGYEPNFEGNYQYLMDDMIGSFRVNQVTKKEDYKINGLPASLLVMEAEFQGYTFYYNAAFVASKTKYYQVVVWTDIKNKTDFKQMISQIINSFEVKENKKS